MTEESRQIEVNFHRPKKFTLAHETDSGSQCLKCGPEKCPGGLDLHFWRKICKTCKCKPEDHELKSGIEFQHDIVVHSMFSKDSPISHIRDHFTRMEEAAAKPKTEFVKKFTWVPPGLTQGTGDKNGKVPSTGRVFEKILTKYMDSLPEEKRPLVGTEGAKYRRKQMMNQLPIHDHDPEYCDNLTEEEKDKMKDFCRMRNEEALGVGDIREKTQPATKWDCYRCSRPMMAGEIAVFASRAGENKCWHPGCFVCCQCNELLVDLIYFYRDDNIYCGRHYAETFKPRCAACDELIFCREYTQAEDRNWHVKHFCCFECDKRLAGHMYVAHDNHPHCLDCYDKFYAKICQTCHKPIAADAQRIEYESDYFHATEDCFCCAMCRTSLVGKNFMKKRKDVFCSVECAKRTS